MKYIYYDKDNNELKATDNIDWTEVYNNPSVYKVTTRQGRIEFPFFQKTNLENHFKGLVENYVESQQDNWLAEHCKTEVHEERVDGRLVVREEDYSQEDVDESYNEILLNVFSNMSDFDDFIIDHIMEDKSLKTILKELLRKIYYTRGNNDTTQSKDNGQGK